MYMYRNIHIYVQNISYVNKTEINRDYEITNFPAKKKLGTAITKGSKLSATKGTNSNNNSPPLFLSLNYPTAPETMLRNALRTVFQQNTKKRS